MHISNSREYDSSPLVISPKDLAVLFDEHDIGVKRQAEILDDIWVRDRYSLPCEYYLDRDKKRFIKDTMYQCDYLYQKQDVDEEAIAIVNNAGELGVNLDVDDITEDYNGMSVFFKDIWFIIHYVNESGFTRAKLRTILKEFHYKRRTERFCEYFDKCVRYYHLECTEHGYPVDIRTVPLDTMITFRDRG